MHTEWQGAASGAVTVNSKRECEQHCEARGIAERPRTVMAYVAMAYVVMAYVVMAL